jgi:hypothetical protein
MSRDDVRKTQQEAQTALLGARLEELQEIGQIESYARLDFAVTLRNGSRMILDMHNQWPYGRRGNGTRLAHGMKRERANLLRTLPSRVLVIIAEPPGWCPDATEYVVLRQWLDVLDEVGDPVFLPQSQNIVWARDAFSLDPMPTTSTRVRLAPLRPRLPV